MANLKFTEFVPEFDQWGVYVERLEQHFAANSIPDEKKVAVLLSSIGASAYSLVRDLCFPKLPKDLKFEELTSLLEKQYGIRVSVWRERCKFYELRQSDGEQISEWYARLRNAATKCGFGNLNSILTDRFVTGLTNGRILDRICEESETNTLDRLVELAMKVENTITTQVTSRPIHQISSSREAHHARHDVDRQNNGRRFQQRRHSPFDRNRQGRSSDPSQSREHARNHAPNNRRRGGNNGFQTSASASTQNVKGNKCKHCGYSHSFNSLCKFRNYQCKLCNKTGHLANVCSRANRKVNFLEPEDDLPNVNEDDDLFYCHAIEPASEVVDICQLGMDRVNPFNIFVEILGKNHRMIIDSGAGLSCLRKSTYLKDFSNFRLKKDSLVLRGYNGATFTPEGYFTVAVKYNNVIKPVKFYIVSEGSADILGRDWINSFKVKIELINQISINDEVNKLLNKFSNVFTQELGKFKPRKIRLETKTGVSAVFCRHRTVPLAYREKVDRELDRLEDLGVIQPIENSSWATPIVPVLKSNGKLRICGDYKTTVNLGLQEFKYPLPKIDEIWDKVRNGEQYSKIDLQLAYMQFPVDEDTSKLLSWNTHRGLYAVHRLPFGITSAGSIFQKEMENLFKGMEGVQPFLDDILITGPTTQDHLQRLEEVFKKLEEVGLTVCPDKCVFFKDEVEYLGFKISKEGLRKTDSKMATITKAKKPTNITEVRAFTGLVNYYHKFLPNIAHILSPIYNLLKSNIKFHWSKECDSAFEKIKSMIASDTCLIHFDPNLQTIITTDASDKGIAGVLSQIKNGEERTVACVSRTLMPAEQKMSTVEKEALAVYFTVNKFFYYLCCSKFKIRTDCRALVALYGEHRSIPKMSANRLQRWAVFLSTFNYTIEHIKGKNNPVADYMSRMPLETITTTEEAAGRNTYICFTEGQGSWPVNNAEVRKATQEDAELSEVIEIVKNNSWTKKPSDELRPYYQKREELYVDHGILMWGHRLVIPKSLRAKMLSEIHTGHFGIQRCKNMARSFVYWPGIDKEIERMVKRCSECLLNRDEPPQTTDKWPETREVFERVHIDFLQLRTTMCLILVDSFSKWIEVIPMRTTTAAETEEKLRQIFATFGLPKNVISDNGPQLVSARLEQFFRKNGITHTTSPPFHPASNGAAERQVRTFKNKLKTALIDPRNKETSLATLISRFLITYRNTKNPSKSPAEIVFNRQLRTRLSQIKEKPELTEKSTTQNQKSKREFMKGDYVMVRDYRKLNTKTWSPATIKRRTGKNTYLCTLNSGQIWKRHSNQIISQDRDTAEPPGLQNTELNNDYTYIKLPNVDVNLHPEPVTPGVRSHIRQIPFEPPSANEKPDSEQNKSCVNISINPKPMLDNKNSKSNICNLNNSDSDNQDEFFDPMDNNVPILTDSYRQSGSSDCSKNTLKLPIVSHGSERPKRISKAPSRFKDYIIDIDNV